jgi:hypothetical protein
MPSTTLARLRIRIKNTAIRFARERSPGRFLRTNSGNGPTSLIDQAPRGVLIQRSKSRHIERQSAEDSCIAIRRHRDQPDVDQLACEFANCMHSRMGANPGANGSQFAGSCRSNGHCRIANVLTNHTIAISGRFAVGFVISRSPVRSWRVAP